MHNGATKEVKKEAKRHVADERIQALKSLASNLEASISESANQESRAQASAVAQQKEGHPDPEASDSNSQASSLQSSDSIATPYSVVEDDQNQKAFESSEASTES